MAHYTVVILRDPQNGIGNSSGPYTLNPIDPVKEPLYPVLLEPLIG